MFNRAHLAHLCMTMTFLSQTISGVSSETALSSPEEIENYFYESVENIQTTIDKISQIPSDERTFQNSLKAWSQLVNDLQDTANTLSSISCSVEVENWHSYINSAVFQNANLRNALIAYAQNPSDEEALSPYEQQALQHFLVLSYQNATPAYTQLPGLAKNKDSNLEDLTLFHFNANSKEKIPLESLLEKILEANADVVCIQDITDMNSSYTFYDSLKEQYAHFYTIIDIHGFLPNFSKTTKKMLIASKYSIENPQYTAFSNTCGFIDFALKNGDSLLGHVYAAQLTPEGKAIPIGEILAAMVSKYQKNIPFLLCGNLGMDEPSDPSQELLKTYFTYSSKTSTLLLRPGASKNSNHQIKTASVYISDNHQAELSSIKEPKAVIQDYSPLASHKPPPRAFQNNKNYIILCEANEGNDNNKNPTEQRAEREYERERNEHGRVEVSLGSESNQGKNSINAGVGFKSPNGWEARVEGNFSQDSQGNKSHKVEGRVSFPIGGN